MIPSMLAALAGTAAGMLHVLSGPDHLAAVAPLAVDARRGGWRAGVRWGIGHSAGVLLVALAALALRGFILPDRVSAWGERLVGVALIAIGAWGLRRALAGRLHAHVHLHWHGPAAGHELRRAHAHGHAAVGMGVLHGITGGSHFLGVLPALALPTLAASAAYLAAFGAGTVAAMGGYALLLGAASGTMSRQGEAAWRGLMGASAAAAVIVGGFWIVRG